MSDLEAPRESALFEAKQARIGDLIQSAVAEDLDKGFVWVSGSMLYAFLPTLGHIRIRL